MYGLIRGKLFPLQCTFRLKTSNEIRYYFDRNTSLNLEGAFANTAKHCVIILRNSNAFRMRCYIFRNVAESYASSQVINKN